MRIVIALLALTASQAVSPAAAEEAVCMKSATMVAFLREEYGERITFTGLVEDGGELIQIFSREDTSWSLVIADSNGRSCLVAAGQQWIGEGIPQGEPG